MTDNQQPLWITRTPDDKRQAVRELVETHGATYRQAASALGTSRESIAGVIERARRAPGQAIIKSRNPEGAPPGSQWFITRGLDPAARARPKPKKDKSKHAGFHKFIAMPGLPSPAAEPPARTDVWAALPGSNPVAIEDHHAGCRWPIGLDRPFGYCNQPTRDGSVLCTGHHAIAYRPVPVRQAVRKDTR